MNSISLKGPTPKYLLKVLQDNVHFKYHGVTLNEFGKYNFGVHNLLIMIK